MTIQQTQDHTKTFSPVHVIVPPWYDAVVDVPSAKHWNGVLDALE